MVSLLLLNKAATVTAKSYLDAGQAGGLMHPQVAQIRRHRHHPGIGDQAVDDAGVEKTAAQRHQEACRRLRRRA